MNKGIEILLERMKSNPEEFTSIEGYANKWATIVREYEGILNPEDVKAFHDARNALLQEQFTSEVMKELLDPKSENNPYQPKSVMGLGGATQGGYTLTTNGAGQHAWQATNATTTLTSNSFTLGQTQLQEAQLKAMLEEVKARQKAREEAQAKKSKTLFGKLFNYQ